MHEIIDVPGENVAAVSLSDTLTEDDFDAVYPFIKDQVERHNTVRLLFEMDGVDGWEPEEVWDDFVFDVRHAHDVDRVAVLTDDEPFEAWMKRLDLAFPSAHVEVYETSERDSAIAWLNGEDLEVDVPSPKGQKQ
ncbi:STAS/SEC14 domain-containing protein [Longibacter salinarum]|uniref:STAS/SEC14 domain-containing protein n=1 Tax=Longibacter salinarum TaxID=1850348 RepID=A0A2A8CY54_9BACT|nr:STAS/SEC14 domain-containing protein [Longibacter salinarum]PEN13541.1 STAS/SEC14 domain-containing protein [Longibacter salinarum]